MRRPITVPLIAAVALACSSSPSAESVLADAAVGTWVGEQVGLLISRDNVLLSITCIAVAFPEIAPESDGSFEILGLVGASPNGIFNGRPARLTGRLGADVMEVNYALNVDDVWPEPTTRTVAKDDTANYFVDGNCIQGGS